MIASQLPCILAAGFGTGVGVGISTGLVTGLLFGAAAGAASVNKKIRQKLTASIETGKISVVDENGKSLSADSIAELLNEKSDKS